VSAFLRDVLIRPYETEDARGLLEAAVESTGEIFPWMDWCHPGYALEDAARWIRRCAATWSERTEYNFAIIDARGRFLGGCGLNQLRPEHRIANLGYWVRTSAANRGVATAAVRMLGKFAFTCTNLVRLEIVVAVDNAPSQRVAEKVGAIREGVLHDRLLLHETPHDAALYALLRSRYVPSWS